MSNVESTTKCVREQQGARIVEFIEQDPKNQYWELYKSSSNTIGFITPFWVHGKLEYRVVACFHPEAEFTKVRYAELPKEWWGKKEEKLRHISQIQGAIYCARNGAIAGFKTLEAARKAAEYLREKEL